MGFSQALSQSGSGHHKLRRRVNLVAERSVSAVSMASPPHPRTRYRAAKAHNFPARSSAIVKRFLFSFIDHFSLHFTNLDGYQKYWGIGPDRASYLPSKPN